MPISANKGDDMHLKGQSGQSATEYMLMIAVIVLGLVSAASYFVPQFKGAVQTMGGTVTQWLSNNPNYQNPNE